MRDEKYIGDETNGQSSGKIRYDKCRRKRRRCSAHTHTHHQSWKPFFRAYLGCVRRKMSSPCAIIVLVTSLSQYDAVSTSMDRREKKKMQSRETKKVQISFSRSLIRCTTPNGADCCCCSATNFSTLISHAYQIHFPRCHFWTDYTLKIRFRQWHRRPHKI